jgi:hypothetical protein
MKLAAAMAGMQRPTGARKPLRLLLSLLAMISASGCDSIPGLAADPALAASSGSSSPASPDCASCHAYPLHDINHYYHLVSADPKRYRQGQPAPEYAITCLDCHFNSLQHFAYRPSDSEWAYRPIPTLGSSDTARGRALAGEIDSLIVRYARAGSMAQWRTGFRHWNGKVDVAFPPDNVTSSASLGTAYNPRDLSCSTVECHKKPAAVYRWMSPRRGFGNCPSFDGNDPTCSEIPASASAHLSPP